MMSHIEIIGIIAGILSSSAYFPQVFKLFKYKQTSGLSIGMYALSMTGSTLWFFYGLYLHSLPLILFNVINIISIISTLIMIYLYQPKLLPSHQNPMEEFPIVSVDLSL